MKNIRSLLEKRWSTVENGVINGAWTEDGSPYYIKGPSQLMPALVELQNAMFDRFTELDSLESKIADMKRDLERVLK
jgi:hypothetical protein